MQCGFREVGNAAARCPDDAAEIMEIEIMDSSGIVEKRELPICKFHGDTWNILIGPKGLAALIRDGKLFFLSIPNREIPNRELPNQSETK